MVNLDRLFDTYAIWHIDKEPTFHIRFVQSCVFCRAETRFTLHEMLLHQLSMLLQSLFKRKTDHPSRQLGNIVRYLAAVLRREAVKIQLL